MTYGWAILIIAIVMVALFSLGILGGSPLGTSCLAQSGYICQTPIAHSGVFSATLGQSTGNQWATANFVWVPQGVVAPPAPTGVAAYCTTGAFAYNAMTYVPGSSWLDGPTCGYYNGVVQNGQTVSVNFPFNGLVPAVGTSGAGQIWAYYQLTSQGTWYSTQIATVTVKTT